MAELVTVVRTYFKSGNYGNGNYRNNTIVIDIPDEAAKLITEHWSEKGGVFSNTAAKFLASNQEGICLLYKGGKEIAVIKGMSKEYTQREEVFEQHFKDEEDEDNE